jgi:hypothetical protein
MAMNERIRELMEEAGIYDFVVESMGINEEMEKFAELLIQQCMACSTWVGKMNTNSVEPVHTAHAINQRIKQQFGVE